MATTTHLSPNVAGLLASEGDLRDRAKALLNAEIDFIDSDEFHAANSVSEIQRIANADHVDEVTAIDDPTSPRELPTHLARLCDAELLTAERERELFRRMNFLKFQANAARCRLDLDDPSATAIENVESLIRRAELVRDRILRANMRLVVSVVKKFVSPQFSFDELLSDGIVTLMQTVEKFDYSRGFRFSTYAYRSITRNAYHRVMQRKKEQSQFVSVADENLAGAGDCGTASMNERTWQRLRGFLGKFLDRLDQRERLIIRARYALGKEIKVQTFQSLANKLGVSKERVRQLEQRAVGKLKTMAAESVDDPSL